MHTPTENAIRPSRIGLLQNPIARHFILALLVLSLAACGQKGGLYREKKPESRFTSDAALLLP
jgi:hypothetical protein